MSTFYPKWYRGKLKSIKHTDKVRGDLAFQTLEKAKNHGYQLVVVDGHSSRSFRKELIGIKGINLIIRRAPRRSEAKRQGIEKASKLPNVKAIIITEPEKLSFIDFVPQVVAPLLIEDEDIIIPARNNKLFKSSYPDYMYQSEIEANELYNELLRSFGIITKDQEFDMFFGPRAFKNEKNIVSLFMKKFVFKDKYALLKYFEPEEFSNVLFFPVIEGLKKGYKVKNVEVDFVYPNLQKRNEESGQRELFLEKRKSQKMGLLIDLMHFVSYLEKNSASRLKRKE
ncbi:hypothetical protein C4559_02535 [Candidatus Microgenomates bacterium]|nr:MAG: hypothetical protein C4559_02535 [Candidatus Microgenomates bacterium]